MMSPTLPLPSSVIGHRYPDAVLLEIGPQRAGVAARDGSAVCFADRDEQRMVFIVHICIAWEVIHEKSLNLIVRGCARDQTVTGKDSLGIGVHDKERHVACIEENRVCRFRADSRDAEKGLSKHTGFLPEHPMEAPLVSCVEESEKVVEASSLDGKEACGSNQLLEATKRQG